MKHRFVVMLLAILPIVGFTQTDTLIHKLDSLSRKADSAGGQINNIDPHTYDANTRLNFKSYFTLLGSDLKQEFTKPFHIKKHDWGNMGRFALVAGALAFADEPIQQKAFQITNKNPGLEKASSFVTNFGSTYEVISLAAFGSYGIIFHNEKMKTTTLLATQAYITGIILTDVLKFAGGRTRPSLYAVSDDAEPQFLGPFPKNISSSNRNSYNSFPSGHTTVAFAAATVFASEYRNKPWVPILAYSSATLIGLSRITENKHWATDVLAGAAIGFLAGKNVVNNYHRYAKLKAPAQKKIIRSR